MLSLSWFTFDKSVDLIRSLSIFQLTSLPKLQELTLGFKGCLCVGRRCSPNLQTLEIMADDSDLSFYKLAEDSNYISDSLFFSFGLNTVRQLQLRNVVFGYFRGLDIEFHLIQFILACSPLLQKIVIKLHDSCRKRVGMSYRYVVDLGLARKLLNLH
ncbi:hypothetical protein Tco_1565889 [Tanacetum coccineum]